MSKYEERNLPERYRPMSAWAYVGYDLLFSIPIVGFILLVVFACDSSYIARRNYARSFFCGLLIVVATLLIFIVGAGVSLAAIWEFILQYAQ